MGATRRGKPQDMITTIAAEGITPITGATVTFP
jgi:hypothetical protein